MSTAQQLQRALEERAKEIQQLNDKLRQFETEKSQWTRQRQVFESKQPTDVQQLLAQKRELQQQLQREESEKTELFMQINELIREMAEVRSKPDLSETNQKLQSQINLLSEEKAHLNSEVETVKSKLRSEVSGQQDEVERIKKTHNIEVDRIKRDMERYQQELDVTNAALQSLKLAKSSTKPSDSDIENQTLKNELSKLNRSNETLQQNKKDLELLLEKSKQQQNSAQTRLNQIEDTLRNVEMDKRDLERIYRNLGIIGDKGIGGLEDVINEMRRDKEEENRKRTSLESNLKQFSSNLSKLNESPSIFDASQFKDHDEHGLNQHLYKLLLNFNHIKEEQSRRETEVEEWKEKAERAAEMAEKNGNEKEKAR